MLIELIDVCSKVIDKKSVKLGDAAEIVSDVIGDFNIYCNSAHIDQAFGEIVVIVSEYENIGLAPSKIKRHIESSGVKVEYITHDKLKMTFYPDSKWLFSEFNVRIISERDLEAKRISKFLHHVKPQ